ncbi:MAG: NAD-dependent epimerase/dehydratase family protein, partial [Alphaproteobacteria bacterium]
VLKDILAEHRPGTIYHLASLLSGSSEEDLQATWDINANASFNLLNLAHETGVGTFFFASTVASYGAVEADPMPEDFPQWPENMYGATKVAVERMGVYFRHKHGLDFRCLRFPLVVSPFAPPGAVSAFPSHAFKAASRGEPFRFPVAETRGCHRRHRRVLCGRSRRAEPPDLQPAWLLSISRHGGISSAATVSRLRLLLRSDRDGRTPDRKLARPDR